MKKHLFEQFSPILRELSDAGLAEEIERPVRLLVEAASLGSKRVDVAYAPFDHVNVGARIVIVGLTPGRQQMRNALVEARRQLKAGASDADAMRAAKVFASFSGPMRTNLVAMLDAVGVNRVLGMSTTGSLWAADADHVHFTSALRYPVFVDGANYSGAPSMLTTPLLREHLMSWFAAEMDALRGAIFVPLGPKVTEAVEMVARRIGLDGRNILSGLPHPSGANAERIAFFLGRKERGALSVKVDSAKLLIARAALDAQIALIGLRP